MEDGPFDRACTPGLDCSKIDWPSNRITVKQLRDAEPLLYKGYLHAIPDGNMEVLRTLYRQERLAAERIYAKALGGDDPDPMVSRITILDWMEEIYPKYGICSGREQCKQLLRRIEDAAVEQAVAKGGQDPRKRRSR